MRYSSMRCVLSYDQTISIWISRIEKSETNASDSYRKSRVRSAGAGGLVLEIERAEELNEIIPRWEKRVSLARSIGSASPSESRLLAKKFLIASHATGIPVTWWTFLHLDRRRVRRHGGCGTHLDWRRGRRNEKKKKNLPDYVALTALAPSLNRTEHPAGGILSVGDAVNLILAIRVGQLERCSRFALERSTEVRCLKLLLALIGFSRGYVSSEAAFSSRLVRRVSTNFASTKRTWELRSCFWFPLVWWMETGPWLHCSQCQTGFCFLPVFLFFA